MNFITKNLRVNFKVNRTHKVADCTIEHLFLASGLINSLGSCDAYKYQ